MSAQFDDQLRQRLVAFQTQQGLAADGVADTDTWKALLAGTQGQASATAEATSQATGNSALTAGDGGCDCEVGDQAAAAGTDFSADPESPDLQGVYEDNGDGGPDAPVQLAAADPSAARPAGSGANASSAVPSQCRSTAKACFSISRQTAWLLRPGRQVVLAVPALGGRSGHPTPTGQFHVNFHDRNHVSSKYHAPMPFYVNFAPQVGFHAGSLSTQSHGCVHLSQASAERFFNYLKDGDQVDVLP